MPNPIDDPDLYDHIELGDVESPGVVTLSGHDRKIGWKINSGNAQKGATTVRSCDDPVEFTASFYLADEDDFNDWPAFLEVVNATVATKSSKAVDIYHPDLAENGITSVVKATVMGTVHDGKGGQTRVVKFLEYKPPKPAGGGPKGSKASAKAPDPNQAALDEIAKLTAAYQQTPWGKPK